MSKYQRKANKKKWCEPKKETTSREKRLNQE
jgi:hypothetical protein